MNVCFTDIKARKIPRWPGQTMVKYKRVIRCFYLRGRWRGAAAASLSNTALDKHIAIKRVYRVYTLCILYDKWIKLSTLDGSILTCMETTKN